MNSMFWYAEAFNQDLGTWALDLSNVTDMTNMFNNAKAFNQNLSAWLMPSMVEHGEYIAGMFIDASLSINNKELMSIAWAYGTPNNFSHHDISNAGLMFDPYQIPFSSVAGLHDMSFMWEYGYFNTTRYGPNGLDGWPLHLNSDFSLWDTSMVTNMEGMFLDASEFWR